MLYKRIGKRVRELRIARRYTQEYLSEHAGISLSFLGHIERGTRKMSVDTLVKLCSALNCSADDLLGTGYANTQTRLSAREILKQVLYMVENENP